MNTDEPLTAKLDRACAEITSAIFNLQVVEGRVLDLSTSEAIVLSLRGAHYELKELTLAIVILDRKGS
jgi:hypothetical protein